MDIKYTNFEGDWDAPCVFCGDAQRNHQVELGELDGIQYIHRYPCTEEQRHITKKYVIRSNTVRIVVTLYEIAVYLWNRIPFKEEVKLILRITKRAYIGVRGVIFFYLAYHKRE